LFVANKAAMFPSGSFSLPSLAKDTNNDLSDIGAFYMPVNLEGDVTNTIAQPDMFLSTSKDGKNQEEAKAFINWFMSKAYYPDYLVFIQTQSTVNGIDADIPFYKSIDNKDKAKFVTYFGGGDNYKKISDSVKFDVKRMGQEMLAGKDFNAMLDELNKSWKEARAKIK
jgi:raffinose/stachyose/melibiose transport system substrate-binding protein